MKSNPTSTTNVEVNRPLLDRRLGGITVRENLELYLMALIPVTLIFIFSYVPIYGIVIAFQNFVPGIPMIGDERIDWVGFKHFTDFINSHFFGRLLKNTIWLNLLNLLFGFPIPILFAIVLNEVRNARYKRFTQTASYMPYFISNVVVAGMFINFLQPDGLFNHIRAAFGARPLPFITRPEYFPAIYTLINVWKGFGFNSILYFSAISGIDQELYESGRLDGGTRLQLMRHITIPSILPTIAIMLILQVGSFLGSNTDLIILLYRPSTYRTADTLGTYIYRLGITEGRFSYTTAIGLFMSVIGFALVYAANKASDKLTGFAMW